MVNFQQTDGDSFLNKYLTILGPYFLLVCLSKRTKIYIVHEFEVQYVFQWSNVAMDGPRINQSNCEFVSSYAIVGSLQKPLGIDNSAKRAGQWTFYRDQSQPHYCFPESSLWNQKP